jgi:starvation-inducible DNA-binding protein
MEIDIGIKETDRKKVADQLKTLFADTYSLYYKTHAYHWNVTGPRFQPLHSIFELQYNELWTATDAIAERIRSLGFYAPAGWSDIGKRTSIPEETGVPSADEMIANLVKGHEAVSRTAKKVLEAADQAGDTATDDLVSPRVTYHEKTAWMLRAMLEDENRPGAGSSGGNGGGAAKTPAAKKSRK